MNNILNSRGAGVDGEPPMESAQGFESSPVCQALAQLFPALLSCVSHTDPTPQMPGQKLMLSCGEVACQRPHSLSEDHRRGETKDGFNST